MLSGMWRALALFATALTWLGLSGCAWTKHVPASIEMEPAFVGEPVALAPGAADHLVVVRFPFALDEQSAGELRRRFNEGAYYALPRRPKGRAPADTTLDEAVAKSSYYGFRLQEALQARLPAQVVLHPTELVIDGAGTVRQRSLSALPTATVVVDFFAYIWPQWGYDLIQPLATFGRTLVPLITVRTVPPASPDTAGAVAGMRYLAGLADAGEGPAAFSGAGATVVELLNCPQPDAFLQQNGQLPKSVLVEQRPWRPGAFIAWPTYQLTFDRDQTASDNELAIETAVDGLAGVIADALAVAESNPDALREIEAANVQWYDAAAAEALRGGSPLDTARGELLADFARAEREFLVRQTRDLQARVETTGWAATFREARAKEQQQVDRAKAIGWVGALAAGLVPVPGSTYGTYMLASAVYQAWSTVLVAALMESVREDIAFGEVGSEPISAASLDELRGKLGGIYASRFAAGPQPDARE
jgi:hypothetical protein